MRTPTGPSILDSVQGALCCQICGDVLGVYEPLLVIEGASSRTSSLAREPSLGDGRATAVHRNCSSDAGCRERRCAAP
jgi:hypothetical protein